VLPLPRAVRLVAWGNAALSGATSLDEAGARVVADDDRHRVVGLPGAEEEQTLPVALGLLRRLGVTSLRLALPAPGDPLGLPGPATFNAEATAAGQAVLTDGREALGLLPAVLTGGGDGVHVTTVRWSVHQVLPAWSQDVPSLSEAEQLLQETLRQVTHDLLVLDVARWRPEVADTLRRLREPADGDGLAPGYPARAHRVLALARRVATIADLAGGDPGAAVSAAEMAARERALRPLAKASRRAAVAAANAVREPNRS
jgi:hypothetical protein